MLLRTCRAAAPSLCHGASARACVCTRTHARARRADVPARMLSAVVKRTTGIVGLDVVPNAREVLVKLYEKTLKDIQIIPEHVPYRQDVEKLARYRLDVVRKTEDIATLEHIIGVGQAEELIAAAACELRLIPEYAAWKAWEKPRPVPMDDEYEDLYETLEYVDPDSVDYLGLKQAALKKRAEAEARRRATAAAPPAPAAAPSAAAAAAAKKA